MYQVPSEVIVQKDCPNGMLRVEQLRVEVRVRLLLLHLDGHARALGLLGEERRRLDEPGHDRRRLEGDLETFLAGLLQQRLRLLEILLSRGQVGEVGKAGAGEIVADGAEAAERAR